ncbi:Cystathionine gamma-synthase [Frankliniella fusca]|uniref:Cystathionine gamma-synthase n=1 Tax=Frankliniella fusca TaxID=407009 RepID=A0AAE1HV23_9NEOP|nr:Cystathionine gamma-synthase [Frankliniella fusca]
MPLPLCWAQVSISAAADTDKARSAWSWKMPDQRSLGICLHMYLERDFPAIERIVYPGGSRQLYRLVGCFSRSLGRMQYYENFSEFRRLVEAMDAVLRELCGAVELMRHRFVPLLQTLDCIERVREGSSCPYRDRLPPHIWHQLIRLEADSSLCW